MIKILVNVSIYFSVIVFIFYPQISLLTPNHLYCVFFVHQLGGFHHGYCSYD